MLFKAITIYLIFCFMFVRTVQIISVLHLPCVDLMIHSSNVVAGTAAPVGTVKVIRFIFLYFLFFYVDLHFYICISLWMWMFWRFDETPSQRKLLSNAAKSDSAPRFVMTSYFLFRSTEGSLSPSVRKII